LSGKIDNETISTGEHLLLGKHKAKFNGRFSSRGLDDIREFIVEQIYFELQTDAGQKLWDTTWKGNYLFTPHLLSLNGKLTVHPYSCLMFLDEKNSMVIKNWM